MQLLQRRQYEKVHKLHSGGVDIHAISKQLGICRMTVYRYLRLDVNPTQLQRRPMPSIFDPYVPYLVERWNSGCRNGGQLWHELRELGYPGSRRMVIIWAAQQRNKQGIVSPYTPNKYRTAKQAKPAESNEQATLSLPGGSVSNGSANPANLATQQPSPIITKASVALGA